MVLPLNFLQVVHTILGSGSPCEQRYVRDEVIRLKLRPAQDVHRPAGLYQINYCASGRERDLERREWKEMMKLQGERGTMKQAQTVDATRLYITEARLHIIDIYNQL